MDEEPLVSVVRGEPAPEELAALVIALSGRHDSPAPQPRATLWTTSGRPGGSPPSWRASGLPR
ncbi:acyl-CoA carboxylase subunit epsilon [Symbioplanes lichenis]|uniref:acyl-CoA carboxylase subunit epsilon n=1 Tax=Symbioplanes lichenis TaxID=1629072 RepID=UPI00273827A6|nr:acyl-CoA carboxylase subunit epsilon [Actinoplanes lichenis]